MRLTLRTMSLLAALLVFTSLTLPAWSRGEYPHPAGPAFDKFTTRQYLHEAERIHPEVILLGDSILTKGVDLETFQAQVGVTAYKIDIPGSSSALWYLLVKSTITDLEPAPHVLVILFRDSILTAPTFRTTGPYFDLIDRFAAPDDSLVIERAYLPQLTPLQVTLQEYFPPYTYGEILRVKLDSGLRRLLPQAFGCDGVCADDAMTNVLGDMRPEVFAQSILRAESVLYSPAELDFNARVDQSFLPEIVRLTQERGIQLVFVRAPTNIFPKPADEPPALHAYLADLQAWLAARDIPLIDLSHIDGIGPEQFVDPHHMSLEGKAIFTPIFADAVKAYLK